MQQKNSENINKSFETFKAGDEWKLFAGLIAKKSRNLGVSAFSIE
jgi:hypothetical protein